jgi:hypothetical protein
MSGLKRPFPMVLKSLLILVALTGVPAGYVFFRRLFHLLDLCKGRSSSNWKGGGIRGAPSPIAGAGLPIIAISYGALALLVVSPEHQTDISPPQPQS